MSLTERLRSWLGSEDFVVGATAIAAAVVAGAVLFDRAPDSTHGLFAIFLAGVAVPGVYREQWNGSFDSRLLAAAWALGASVVVLACYLAFATALVTVTGEDVANVTSFVATWLLALFGARVLS